MEQQDSRRNRVDGVLAAAAVLAVAFAASGSAASDGVIEINQARALAGGTTATDTAGFPVTLDSPGSYVLTGNLNVSGSSSAITITASEVTLDLGGFVVQGPCASGAGCSASSGSGVGVSTSSLTRIVVRDGSVRGFVNGVALGSRSRIEGLFVEANVNEGIVTGAQVDVVESRSILNGRSGIAVGGGSKVIRCIADLNGRSGIVMGPRSIISESLARNNVDLAGGLSEGNGIYTGAAVLARANGTSANQRSGIRVEGTANMLLDNVVTENGSVGLYLLSSGSVQRNIITNNSGAAVLTFGSSTSRTSLRENVIDANLSNTLGGGIGFGTNACSGSTSC